MPYNDVSPDSVYTVYMYTALDFWQFRYHGHGMFLCISSKPEFKLRLSWRWHEL